ncbi:MAG: hypothetical protein ACO1Q7_09595 [Gemmatimonas sp.]
MLAADGGDSGGTVFLPYWNDPTTPRALGVLFAGSMPNWVTQPLGSAWYSPSANVNWAIGSDVMLYY